MANSPIIRASLLVVLTGTEGSGGAFHQTHTTLKSLVVGLGSDFNIRVVDIDHGFTALLRHFVDEGHLLPDDVVILAQKPKKLKDRIRSGRGRISSVLRIVLGVSYKHWFAYQIDERDDDILYFVSQSELAGRVGKPYVWTLWDICHIDSPEFEEVRAHGEFERRDRAIWSAARKAALVVVDSTASVHRVSQAFGVPEERLVPVPFSPSPYIADSSFQQGPESVSSLDSIEIPQPYFYYPAQFWTSKNHGRVLDALSILVERGFPGGVVFSGNDRGNLDRIRVQARELGLEKRVVFLKYVSNEDLKILFQNCCALVMASYFGPTNIPPLEAFLLQIPVVASKIHADQLGKAALYFDPDSQRDLAEKLETVLKPATVKKLVNEGAKRLFEIERARSAQEKLVRERIIRLAKRTTSFKDTSI